jgi:hypothetical protein
MTALLQQRNLVQRPPISRAAGRAYRLAAVPGVSQPTEELNVRDVLLSSADALEGEAICLQQSHTKPPEHTDWQGEEDAEDTYNHWVWLACALRKIAETSAA